MAEEWHNLSAPELDELAGRITEVLRTGEPPVEWWGKVRPLYKKGGSPATGELGAYLLCGHGGQVSVDGDFWEDTEEAV